MPKVLVIGDSCLDTFVYCKVERLAPDLPIPVLEEIERTLNPGMAANVFRIGYKYRLGNIHKM